MSLPILNLSLHRTNPALFADQLRKACHEIGFFLLQHDIPSTVCNRALDETHQFFSRPLEEKMTISYEQSPAFRGYMPLGVENTEGKVDGRDQIEYAAEYHGMLRQRKQHPHQHPIMNGEHGEQMPLFYNRLRATNPWPDGLQPTLRPAITEYVSGVLGVADRLRDAMCLALNVDPSDVAPLFGSPSSRQFVTTNNNHHHHLNCEENDDEEPSFWSMKLVSYPPISPDDTATNKTTTKATMQEPLQGVGAHCDSNFLTLICQDAHSSGLQVQNVKGGWIDVPPTGPDMLICNIGELAQVWTGGYFLATPHRVMLQQSSHGRTSLPVFYNPKLDVVMEPIGDAGNLPWDRCQENQWRWKHNTLMNSVGENSFKSLARSHPAVFEKHHGDLRILEDGRIVKR